MKFPFFQGAKTHRQGCSRNITISLIKSPNCPQCTNYSLALPASHISRLPPTFVVFTIKNTVILLWFATSLTNTLSSITVVWTTKSSQLHIGAFCKFLSIIYFRKKAKPKEYIEKNFKFSYFINLEITQISMDRFQQKRNKL